MGVFLIQVKVNLSSIRGVNILKWQKEKAASAQGRQQAFRSGFVAIMGPPNVGKSTLLNTIMKRHFAIVTEKPQTTRSVIRAIKNLRHAQLIFTDTPGIHHSRKLFNRLLMRSAKNACKEADVVLGLITTEEIMGVGSELLLSFLKEIKGIPKILAVNKIDKVHEARVNEVIGRLSKIPSIYKALPISALLGYGIEELMDMLVTLLPEGPPLFPTDMDTDMTERFFASEIIREKVFITTKDEIPYDVAVEIEQFKEDHQRGLLEISAVIHVNRESQKRIIIGKNGSLIKKIGSLARKDMEEFFQIHVFLKLWVRVSRNWMKNQRMLKELDVLT